VINEKSLKNKDGKRQNVDYKDPFVRALLSGEVIERIKEILNE
jgi:hypothetical protein